MSRISRTATLALLAGALIALPMSATTSRQNTIHPAPTKGERDLAPTGKGWGEHHAQGQAKGGGHGGGGKTSNGINYHGGPVMTNGVNMYYIWYGNWSGNNAPSILADLANGIGGSPYFNINTTYYDGNNVAVQNNVTFGGSTTDSYSRGTALADGDIQSIVADAINSGAFGAADPDGIYFVVTSADVNETSGFCTQYCGWHTHGSINGTDVKYSFIGDPTRCPSSCEVQTTGPNGSSGADGMASIISHELEEATTDPDLNAWYDRRGYENADKCAWTFGTEYTTSNGASANMNFGGRDWLIQQNWVNASGGYCAVSY